MSIGRALRWQMSDAARETPERAQERILAREAGARANQEMMERFSPLTTDNAAEAIAWQEARIRDLLGRVA